MSEPQEYLRLADEISDYLYAKSAMPVNGIFRAMTAIRVLATRTREAEARAAEAESLAQTRCHEAAEVAFKLVEAEEAIGAALAVLPAFRPPENDLQHLINLARGLLDVGAVPTRVAELVKAARTAERAVATLIAESGGVYGLHLNGDNAPWGELTEGGRFEEWLSPIADLRQALAAFTEPAAQEKSDGQ